MAFHLPLLPYAKDALEPFISQRTLEFHYDKHHAGYVTKLNQLVEVTPLALKSLEEVILETAAQGETDAGKRVIFNNAAQVAHHTFFWNSMVPQGGGSLKEGPLKQAIFKAFGSEEAFREAFHKAAMSQFGSGWVWLTVDGEGGLVIETSSNAILPKGRALLTCDVWEHAYYLDYQNRRPDYVTTFLNHLANWSFAEDNLKAA